MPSVGAEKLIARQGWLWTYTSNLWTLVHRGWGFDTRWIDLNHTWSLAIEEQFYLLWPLVVRALGLRGLTALCGAIVLASPIARWIFWQFDLAGPGALVVYTFTPLRADGLAMGSILAVAEAEPRLRSWAAAHVNRLAVASSLLALTVLVWRKGEHADLIISTVGFSLINVAFACALAYFVFGNVHQRASNIFQSRLMRAVGKYSYGLYLFHRLVQPAVIALILLVVANDLPSRAPYAFVTLLLVVGTALSWFLAMCSYELWERRFLRMKERWFAKLVPQKDCAQ